MRGLLVVLVVGDLAFAFQQTAVVPAIPSVRSALGASPAWSARLLSAYPRVATAATPVLARPEDLHGRRQTLLGALAVFFLGSVVAATAPGLGVLVIGRAVQRLGGAVFPLTPALAREHPRDERVTRAVAVLTGSFGVGSAPGFTCGGVLAEYVSWRTVFAAGAVVIAGLQFPYWWVYVGGPGRRRGARGRAVAPGAVPRQHGDRRAGARPLPWQPRGRAARAGRGPAVTGGQCRAVSVTRPQELLA